MEWNYIYKYNNMVAVQRVSAAIAMESNEAKERERESMNISMCVQNMPWASKQNIGWFNGIEHAARPS